MTRKPQHILRMVFVLLIVGLWSPLLAQDEIAPWPTESWARSSPEAQGIDSADLLAFLQYIQTENAEIHNVLLIRNGYLVLEANWGDHRPDERHNLMSATKSINSILIGIAVDKGYFAVDQAVVDLFPDLEIADMDDNKAAMTVEHVLTMTGGLRWAGGDVQAILNSETTHVPGSTFEYSNFASRLLSWIVQETSDLDPLDFAQEYLFDPLGITEEDRAWSVSVGVRDGGSGMTLTPLAMAKIGYLFLNQGLWDGEQIVSADWVAESTFPHMTDIPSPGLVDAYGYQWWIDSESGFYTALGVTTQMIAVLPDQNIVLVTTGGARGREGNVLIRAFKTYVLPLAISDEPLPEDPAVTAELDALLEALAMPEDA